MNRMIYVAYGNYEQAKEKLTASAKPLDALLLTGFDVYLEVAPKRWMRAVDLADSHHPAWVNFKQGSYKAWLVDSQGQVFTILNAFNDEHRKLAAQHGLYIRVPCTPNKREELLKRLENIKAQLREWIEIEQFKQQIQTLQQKLKSLPEEPTEQQKAWDGVVNETLSLADALEELSKLMLETGFERKAFREAVEKAKREAAFETSLEESLFLNPKLLSELRKSILEDFT
ncbi:MAG: hypothetical protein ACPL0C_02920 [Candidatus Bathyarchaeales archaeon]